MTLPLFSSLAPPDLFGGMEDLFAGLDDGSGCEDGSRWYQKEAFDGIIAGFGQVDSQLLVMATGLGKTFVASMVVRHVVANLGPVLWLVHGKDLVTQARDELERMTGLFVEIEQGDWHASSRAQIIVGSIDSVRQERRLERLGKDRFWLIVFDEAHQALAPSYQRTLEFFGGKRLGMTATPDRADERPLGQLFDSVAYVMDIEDGISDGHLVPVTGQRVVIKEIQLDDVGTSKNDFVQTQLDDAMVKACEGIVHESLRLYPERHGIFFFPGVRSAEFAMHRFNALQPGSTAFVDGETDTEERKHIIAGFREGRIQRLCNCGVFTTGFDAPIADLIGQGRPTMSRMFYAQTVGRGTRPLKGLIDSWRRRDQAELRREAIAGSRKKDCVVLDFVGNSSKHSLVSVEDVLGGNYTEEEVTLAKKYRERAGGGAPVDARSNLLKARRELLMKANAVKAKKVDASVHTFDPFTVLGLPIRDQDRYTDRFGTKPLTDGQASLLKVKGVPQEVLSTLSKRAASKLIDELIQRQNRRLATYKQLRQLQRFGINRQDLTFDRASAMINYIVSKGWGKSGDVDPKELNAIMNHRRESGED